MLEFELTSEKVELLKSFGLLVGSDFFSNERAADSEGFYWFDEIGAWIDIDGANLTIRNAETLRNDYEVNVY